MVNVCFAYRSIPLLRFSVARGGDWVDEKSALAIGEQASYVCSVKEAGIDLSVQEHSSKIANALAIAYDELIGYVARALTKQIGGMISVPHLAEPLPMIVSGGTATPRGFTERFTRALRAEHFPLEIARVKLAKDPFGSVAQGAMIAAQVQEGFASEEEPEGAAADDSKDWS